MLALGDRMNDGKWHAKTAAKSGRVSRGETNADSSFVCG